MKKWQRRADRHPSVASASLIALGHSPLDVAFGRDVNSNGLGSDANERDVQAAFQASLLSMAADPRLSSPSTGGLAVREGNSSDLPENGSAATSLSACVLPGSDSVSAKAEGRIGPALYSSSGGGFDIASSVSSSKQTIWAAAGRPDAGQSTSAYFPVQTGTAALSNIKTAPGAGILSATASSAVLMSGSPVEPGRAASGADVVRNGSTAGSGMVMALHEGNTPSDLTAAEAWLGGKPGALTVFTGFASWSDFTGSVIYELNTWSSSNVPLLWSLPLIASGATLGQAATGAYNSYYVQAAKELAAGEPTGAINVRVGWEFNASWYPWSAVGDASNYVSAFQQFVDSFRSVSDRFVFTWCPNIGPGGMNPADAYPGDKYVDVIGQDFYWDSKSWNSDPNHVFQTMVAETDGLQWLEDFASAHGKPTAYPEWGIDGDQAGPFIADAAAWFSSHDVSYESYWDSNNAFAGKLSNGDYADAGSAFLQAFGDAPAGPTISSGQTFELTGLVVSGGATFLAGPTSQTQVVSGTTVLSGAYLEPVDGTVLSGGVEIVGSNGVTASTTVSSGGVEQLLAGGAISGGTILQGGVLSGPGTLSGEVDVYGAVSGTFVETAGILVLLSGGASYAVTVGSGGSETVSSGGLAVSALVNGGGLEVVASGGVASATLLGSGGVVSVAGVTIATAIGAGGGEQVLSGGVSYAATVGSGGFETVSSGGLALATTVEDGGDLIASAGSVLSNVTVLSGGELSGGGTISGSLTVWSGGLVEGATLVSGATETLYGVVENGIDICSGAALDLIGGVVSNGVALVVGPIATAEVVSGATLSSGATLTTLSTTVLSGGSLSVASGGVASATGVSNGGVLRLSAGAVASGVTVAAQGSLLGAGTVLGLIGDAGLVSGVAVGAGATLDVLSAGTATNVSVLAGGVVSALTGGIVNGTLTVSSGGMAQGALMSAGGTEYLFAGGIDSSVKISSGAVLELVGATISAGTSLAVGARTLNYNVSGATLSSGAKLGTLDAVVLAGGSETVLSGGLASATTVSSGGVERLSSGSYAEGATVLAGGVLSGAGALAKVVSDQGQVDGVAVGAGALLDVLSGGVVSGIALRAGATVSGAQGSLAQGRISVRSGTVLEGQISFTSGASDLEYAGAVESGVQLSSGAVLELIGASVSGPTLSAGTRIGDTTVGGVLLHSGAKLTTLSATIEGGGVELVTSGGVVTNTTVAGGGLLSTVAGGIVSGATVLAGGALSGGGTIRGVVTDYGAVTGARLVARAHLNVVSGAAAGEISIVSGATLSAATAANLYDVREVAGGALIDDGTLSYDEAVNATLAGALSGCGEIVESGGATLVLSDAGEGFSGALIISAGTVDLAAAGALGTGTVAFEATAGKATLKVEAADRPAKGATFADILVDFNAASDTLDLRGLAYAKGATAVVAGSTLTLSDGNFVAGFKLGGSAAASYVVASDGSGGTEITAAGAAGAALIHALAAFGAQAATGAASPDHDISSALSASIAGADRFVSQLTGQRQGVHISS